MEFNENDIAITVENYPDTFIYFLIKNNIVVYVGQTTRGISRPLIHKDKDFDTIKIIKCDKKELDIFEDRYIEKYKPKYNKVMNTTMNYSLPRVKKQIRKIFNNNINLIQLKKIINKLNIELHSNEYTVYIKRCDFEKIVEYMRKDNEQ